MPQILYRIFSFIVCAISQVVLLFELPPAPNVTLIKSGLRSLSCSRVLYIVSIEEVFFGGKISKEKNRSFFQTSVLFS